MGRLRSSRHSRKRSSFSWSRSSARSSRRKPSILRTGPSCTRRFSPEPSRARWPGLEPGRFPSGLPWEERLHDARGGPEQIVRAVGRGGGGARCRRRTARCRRPEAEGDRGGSRPNAGETSVTRKAVTKGSKEAAKAALSIAAPLAAAQKAADVAQAVLTGDIVVVRTIENVGTKKHPIMREKEVHYNLVSVGAGALLVGAAAYVAVSAWEGRAGGYFFGSAPRLKDNYDRFLLAHPKAKERLKLNRPG